MSLDNSRFAVLSGDSVKLFAESVGVADLDDDSVRRLAEDVNYRLRELIQSASEFMYHSGRKRLRTSDVNQALEAVGEQQVFGVLNFGNSVKEPKSVYHKEARVFYFEDPVVKLDELADKIINGQFNETITSNDEFRVREEWLTPVDSKSQLQQTSDLEAEPKLCNELIVYYNHMANAILSQDEELVTIALRDLTANQRIKPLLPFFVNLISVGTTKLSHDLTQVRKLLRAIKCLFRNRSLLLPLHSYLTTLVKSIIFCLTEPLDLVHDHWLVRDFAADLLVWIITIINPNVSRQLQSTVVQQLADVLLDDSKSLIAQYGAFAFFAVCQRNDDSNLETIEKHFFVSLVDSFLVNLNKSLASDDKHKKLDAIFILGILTSVIESDLRKQRKLAAEDCCDGALNEWYKKLADLIGDTLTGRLPTDFEDIRRHFYVKKPGLVTLYDQPDQAKTGEELLDSFYERTNHDDNLSVDDDNSNDSDSSDEKEDEIGAITSVTSLKSSITSSGIKLTIKLKKTEKSSNPWMLMPPRSRQKKQNLEGAIFDVCDFKPLKPIKINIKGNKTDYQKIAKQVEQSFEKQSSQAKKRINRIEKGAFRRNTSKSNKLYSCNLLALL